ncbi:FAD synthase [Candidatus Woesearchaeota archaeon]|nr:FAD synthase [Candidatus Woesearchaeota archaeon]
MKRVLVFGTFDIFHLGHEYFLKEAKKHGDELVVVVARDSTVQQVKGSLPHHNEDYRLNIIQKLDYVDKAILGHETADKYKIIDEIKPDTICLGYDQTHFVDGLEKKLRELELRTEIIRLEPYKPHLYKSSHYKKTQ